MPSPSLSLNLDSDIGIVAGDLRVYWSVEKMVDGEVRQFQLIGYGR